MMHDPVPPRGYEWHDHDCDGDCAACAPAMPARAGELGADAIATLCLAGFVAGLLIVAVVSWLTGRPGVLAMFGCA